MIRKSNANVLVVEDVAPLRKKLIEALIKLGFSQTNITEASNGDDAFSAAIGMTNKNVKLDLIITDLVMPDSDGSKLVTEIRKSPQFQDTIIFIVSSETDKEKIISLVNKKIHSFIIKPFDFVKLSAQIHRHFND